MQNESPQLPPSATPMAPNPAPKPRRPWPPFLRLLTTYAVAVLVFAAVCAWFAGFWGTKLWPPEGEGVDRIPGGMKRGALAMNVGAAQDHARKIALLIQAYVNARHPSQTVNMENARFHDFCQRLQPTVSGISDTADKPILEGIVRAWARQPEEDESVPDSAQCYWWIGRHRPQDGHASYLILAIPANAAAIGAKEDPSPWMAICGSSHGIQRATLAPLGPEKKQAVREALERGGETDALTERLIAILSEAADEGGGSIGPLPSQATKALVALRDAVKAETTRAKRLPDAAWMAAAWREIGERYPEMAETKGYTFHFSETGRLWLVQVAEQEGSRVNLGRLSIVFPDGEPQPEAHDGTPLAQETRKVPPAYLLEKIIPKKAPPAAFEAVWREVRKLAEAPAYAERWPSTDAIRARLRQAGPAFAEAAARQTWVIWQDQDGTPCLCRYDVPDMDYDTAEGKRPSAVAALDTDTFQPRDPKSMPDLDPEVWDAGHQVPRKAMPRPPTEDEAQDGETPPPPPANPPPEALQREALMAFQKALRADIAARKAIPDAATARTRWEQTVATQRQKEAYDWEGLTYGFSAAEAMTPAIYLVATMPSPHVRFAITFERDATPRPQTNAPLSLVRTAVPPNALEVVIPPPPSPKAASSEEVWREVRKLAEAPAYAERWPSTDAIRARLRKAGPAFAEAAARQTWVIWQDQDGTPCLCRYDVPNMDYDTAEGKRPSAVAALDTDTFQPRDPKSMPDLDPEVWDVGHQVPREQ